MPCAYLHSQLITVINHSQYWYSWAHIHTVTYCMLAKVLFYFSTADLQPGVTYFYSVAPNSKVYNFTVRHTYHQVPFTGVRVA